MLRNLFLAIFLFALALPALAVPVGPAKASAPVATEEQDDGSKRGNSVQLHGCIGCIAPVSPVFAVVQLAELPFVTQSAPHRELSSTVAGPNIPPPRS
jgi:hypothetical protein